MEHASADEMPEDAEHKGIGTPATRAGVIEKRQKKYLKTWIDFPFLWSMEYFQVEEK